MKELLKLQNVNYEIMDISIFEDVNASVQQGEIIGVIGKNGAGKSTLLQVIHNDIVPMKGKIQWLEPDLKMIFVEQETEVFSSEEITPSEGASEMVCATT